MVTLTVTRAVLAQHGLRPGEMQETELSPEVALAYAAGVVTMGVLVALSAFVWEQYDAWRDER